MVHPCSRKQFQQQSSARLDHALDGRHTLANLLNEGGGGRDLAAFSCSLTATQSSLHAVWLLNGQVVLVLPINLAYL